MIRVSTFCGLLALASAPLVTAGELVLSAGDIANGAGGVIVVDGIEGAPRNPDLPVVRPGETSAAASLLRRLVARGQATGFDRILYENRDRDHSTLDPAQFPNLTFLEYDSALQERGLDYGAASRLVFPAVLLGNSSTAFTKGLHRRSQTRNEMTRPGGAALAYQHYRSNSIYIYPEHRDHDAYDLFPINWPYTVISQGSSGSDQAFLSAIALTLAAFSPQTRARLEQEGLIPAAVQMILRRSMKGINSPDDYLSGRAHPVVFDGDNLRPALMVSTAANLTSDAIPPMVRLRVEDESFSDTGDWAGLTERIADTPSAIARIFRAPRHTQHITLSAAQTKDPNGRDLTFNWVLLQGDPARVRITPLDKAGTRARIEVSWHDAFEMRATSVPATRARTKSRVDIGVFADNGVTDSAPAILSVSFPTHQRRRFEDIAGATRLVEIDYNADARADPVDPRLFWSAPWQDIYSYDDSGVRSGFIRRSAEGDLAFDADGRLTPGRDLRYRISKRDGAIPLLRFDPVDD